MNSAWASFVLETKISGYFRFSNTNNFSDTIRSGKKTEDHVSQNCVSSIFRFAVLQRYVWNSPVEISPRSYRWIHVSSQRTSSNRSRDMEQQACRACTPV